MKVLLRTLLLLAIGIPSGVNAQQLQYPTAVSANSGNMVSRSPDSRAWSDPALNHNRLLQNQAGDGVYILVGPYKVKGSPFLYGERLKGDMFTPEAKAWNISLSYNAYTQDLDFYSTSNPNKPLTREPGTVDSFILHRDSTAGIMQPLRFVASSGLGQKDKGYYQVLYKGPSYQLYKRYKADLAYVQDNITQSELRQFDILVDYYYSAPGAKGLKKLKSGQASLEKEFKGVKDIGPAFAGQEYAVNPEAVMIRVFEILNQ